MTDAIDKPLSLSAALAALGSTQADVATTLTAGGWTGLQNDTGFCPVATFLASMGFTDIAVDPDCISAHDGYSLDCVRVRDSAVAEFVCAFDDDQYPHLIANRDTERPGPVAKTEPAPAPEMGAAE